eukprot:TRINITY_DN13615_c0_g1_i3.p1 TRINITY_DN13615_c0_g1~~TRINITY_DN13615_c0_g1_i3.p1  ORF type:complete len:132 (+),score=34.54 TRINITY_DN13615_c0_g1_i3:257-652(+)
MKFKGIILLCILAFSFVEAKSKGARKSQGTLKVSEAAVQAVAQAEIDNVNKKLKNTTLGVFYDALKTLHTQIRDQTKSVGALTLLSEKTAELLAKSRTQQKEIRKVDKLLERQSRILLEDLSQKFENKCKK